MKWTATCGAWLGAALLLAGCGGHTIVGTPAPADAPLTPLAEILDAPEAYDGQTVVLRGTITGVCASRCDFSYAEGGRSVTIFMGAEKAPRVAPGRPVRVTASVHRGERQVVLTALGVEVQAAGRAP